MQAWASLQDFKQNGAQHGDCVDSNTLTLPQHGVYDNPDDYRN